MDLLTAGQLETKQRQSFEEEVAAIVADPLNRPYIAHIKAVARFLMGGVVERAELADKSAYSCVRNCCSNHTTLLQVYHRTQETGQWWLRHMPSGLVSAYDVTLLCHFARSVCNDTFALQGRGKLFA